MLDPSSAGRPRSRSASMVSQHHHHRVPHITVEVNGSSRSSMVEQARDQHLELSPTRSLPTPTIHIMNDFSSSTYAPAVATADSVLDTTCHNRHSFTSPTHGTPSISSMNMNLEPGNALHRRPSFGHGGDGTARKYVKREERLRRLSTASAMYNHTSALGNDMEDVHHAHAHHHFPTIRHEHSQAFRWVMTTCAKWGRAKIHTLNTTTHYGDAVRNQQRRSTSMICQQSILQ